MKEETPALDSSREEPSMESSQTRIRARVQKAPEVMTLMEKKKIELMYLGTWDIY